MVDLEMFTPKANTWDRYGFPETESSRAIGSTLTTTRFGSDVDNDDGSSGFSDVADFRHEPMRAVEGHGDMVVQVRTTVSVVEAQRKSSKAS